MDAYETITLRITYDSRSYDPPHDWDWDSLCDLPTGSVEIVSHD